MEDKTKRRGWLICWINYKVISLSDLSPSHLSLQWYVTPSSQQMICTHHEKLLTWSSSYVQTVLSVENTLPFFSLKQTLIILQDSSNFLSPINPFQPLHCWPPKSRDSIISLWVRTKPQPPLHDVTNVCDVKTKVTCGGRSFSHFNLAKIFSSFFGVDSSAHNIPLE